MSRVLVLDEGKPLDIFEVVEVTEGLARVRSAYLFELGEEMKLRLEENGAVYEVIGRVRAHVGNGADKVTELELSDKTAVS